MQAMFPEQAGTAATGTVLLGFLISSSMLKWFATDSSRTAQRAAVASAARKDVKHALNHYGCLDEDILTLVGRPKPKGKKSRNSAK
jgi:hypothetical protein